MVQRIERYLHKSFVGLAFAFIALVTILIAGGVAYDNDRKVWDIQTFALLVGVGGYFASQVIGKPRAASVELAFVWTAVAAIYASVTGPSSEQLLPLLGMAILLGVAAVLFRKVQSEETPDDAAVAPCPGQPAVIVGTRSGAAGQRHRNPLIRNVAIAVIAGVAGGLVARLGRRP